MKTLQRIVIQKFSIYPHKALPKGDSANLARQTDITLMGLGFKLSHKLYLFLSQTNECEALKIAEELLYAVRDLLGDLVQHNVYFKQFPQNVPSTEKFWIDQVIKLILKGNCEYGRYQHSYTEMLEVHKEFKFTKTRFRVIELGDTLDVELKKLYTELAGSSIPLNKEDRALIGYLYQEGYNTECNIAMRENKAIINALRLAFNEPITIDTPIDALRLACAYSGGDVTLTEGSIFKSFKRAERRTILKALESVSLDKAGDILNYQEEFKRLGEVLHPGDYKDKHPNAYTFFAIARGDEKIKTWNAQVCRAYETGDNLQVISLLKIKPGYLYRSIDKIARDSNDSEFETLISTLQETSGRVSARLLLSVYEHLLNRNMKLENRIFINKKGKAFAKEDLRPTLSKNRSKALFEVLKNEIAKRIPAIGALYIDPAMRTLAAPLTSKTKSDGFSVLPRGSTLELENKDTLRLFIYWRQKEMRTDYDLSCAFFNEDFKLVNQVSWTNLKGENIATHSGDITEALNGASEFIDIRLDRLNPEVKFIIPSVNVFSGELFSNAEEAFFGFMMRKSNRAGKPFEPQTVRTKFALTGNNRVCLPLIFSRTNKRYAVKWMDLYAKGLPYFNTVEKHTNMTLALAQNIYKKTYHTLGDFLKMYEEKASKILNEDELRKTKSPVTYIGLDRFDRLPEGSTLISLNNLGTLIPK